MSLENSDFHIFGPFVPLFVPWAKMLTQENNRFKSKVMRRLKSKYYQWRDNILSLLSKEYFYITVSINADGIEGRNENRYILPENMIVISGGGKGHIPTLIFLKEHNPNNFSIKNKYEYGVVFSGYEKYRIRNEMVFLYNKLLGKKFLHFKNRVDWTVDYGKAKFVLAPRGYGRNSFRLCETLQSGRIPIYIYDDIIWLPYYDSINWNSFAIITNVTGIDKTIKRIKETSPKEIKKMREKIRNLYYSHFTFNGTVNQIKLFLLYGFAKSDLRCAKYSTVRGPAEQKRPSFNPKKYK